MFVKPRGLDPMNSVSILEALARVAALSARKIVCECSHQNRAGDHIWYISGLSKMNTHYPEWDITKTIEHIFGEIYETTVKGH
jgi:CDP-paratose 2-epimerase